MTTKCDICFNETVEDTNYCIAHTAPAKTKRTRKAKTEETIEEKAKEETPAKAEAPSNPPAEN